MISSLRPAQAKLMRLYLRDKIQKKNTKGWKDGLRSRAFAKHMHVLSTTKK
jgi:hypothetical protein